MLIIVHYSVLWIISHWQSKWQIPRQPIEASAKHNVMVVIVELNVTQLHHINNDRRNRKGDHPQNIPIEHLNHTCFWEEQLVDGEIIKAVIHWAES